MNEEWKPVIGCEGAYEVSSHGRVRSLDRVVVYRNGTRFPYKGRVLRDGPCGGYRMVEIIGKSRLIHILVAAAFIGPRPDGLEVNHIDGDKTNNRADNLEYVTGSENMLHARKVGLYDGRGESNGWAKLTEDNVREILLNPQIGPDEFAHKFGCDRSNILKIRRRSLWKHVQIGGAS